MNRLPLDETTAEALLSGRLSPDDAPPGYGSLAAMFQAVTGPAAADELAGEAAVVAAGIETVRLALPSSPTPSPRRKSMLGKLLSAKIAAVAATAFLGAGTAAAATGNLPDPAQSAVSKALSHVNVSVPGPNSHANNKAKDKAKDEATDRAGTENENSNREFGLCTAFLAGPNSHANSQATANTQSGKNDSTAFAGLIAANGGSIEATTAHCQQVVADHPGQDNKPADAGKPDDAGKPEGAGKPADAGKPDDARKPDGAGKPADAGKPDDAGKPADVGKPADPGSQGDGGLSHRP